jgi:NADH-quinone oxidoreductase subunit F
MDPARGPLDIDAYQQAGGYAAASLALKQMTPREVKELVSESRLRGRGGAGFPTGKKWSFVPDVDQVPPPRYLVVNADEMEPGTFKDRYLMEGDPLQLIEGVLISAYAIQADQAFVFLRGEYTRCADCLRRAIAEAYAAGWLGRDIQGLGYHLELHLHLSAGRYLCGEETALLSALEGGRALPRSKPPYPQAAGLWGRPTVVNNVETLCNVPHIVQRGAAWFRDLSRSEDGGTKLYGISGRVRHTGLWELPMGTPLRQLLEEQGGGMRDGYRLRGVQPGGASTEFLGPDRLDTALDFDRVMQAGSRLGTGCLVVLDDHTCPVGLLQNLQHFFAQESCGWCTPCREGLPQVNRLLQVIEQGRGRAQDLQELESYTRLLNPGTTFCAHAPGAMEPLTSALELFREDFERHIREGHCPYGNHPGGRPV